MGKDGQLEDGDEKQASTPDEVANELDKEYPGPFLERKEGIRHANVKSYRDAEVILLLNAVWKEKVEQGSRGG